MSGSTGAVRIQSREDYKQFIDSYTQIISKFPGFVSARPSGSYNSNLAKKDFGDIDLITHIKSNKDKSALKKDLAAFFDKMPDDVIARFSSEKYAGRKFLNTGEIVTIRYHDKKLGYSAQIDNIIAIDKDEADFKLKFLDFPAEKQGLILGLVKVAAIEHSPEVLFRKLNISAPKILPKDEEYEFNLSSIELQLRHVVYEPGTFKQKSRSVVWSSRNFNDLQKLLFEYNLDDTFEGLISQAKKHLKNPRSNARMRGVFTSMISVKSGEKGTEKGFGKEAAINKVLAIFGEDVAFSFSQYIAERENHDQES